MHKSITVHGHFVQAFALYANSNIKQGFEQEGWGCFSLSRRRSDSQLPGELPLLKGIYSYQSIEMPLQTSHDTCLVMQNTAAANLVKNMEISSLEKKCRTAVGAFDKATQA